ncbi:MAG TPA: hypothetical protein V6D22_26450 [Candidatus Obscuribacterales bacterium]
MKLRQIILSLALAAAMPAAPACLSANTFGDLDSNSEKESKPATFKLQGHAEVETHLQQAQRDMVAWQASQMYRQGAYFMAINDFVSAAECFKQAGDGFENSLGPGKFLGESRYAEAQARRLLKQNARAAQLFQVAIDLFEQYDPRNPFLKAGIPYLDQLTGKKHSLQGKASKLALAGQVSQNKLELQWMRPHNDFIDNHVNLKAHVVRLDDGTQMNALKDEELFGGAKKLQEPLAAEISDQFLHDHLYKAFLKMTCLEMAELGGNIYTAPDSYKAFKSGDKSMVVGASDSVSAPLVDMKLNGHTYDVPVSLPGLNEASKNVLLATDGLHVIAIDPRTTDTWKLTPNVTKSGTEFSWWKLTHRKDRPIPPAGAMMQRAVSARSTHVSSPFAR